MKNPYVLAGIAVFMLVGAYLFGVDGVIEMFKAIAGNAPGEAMSDAFSVAPELPR